MVLSFIATLSTVDVVSVAFDHRRLEKKTSMEWCGSSKSIGMTSSQLGTLDQMYEPLDQLSVL